MKVIRKIAAVTILSSLITNLFLTIVTAVYSPKLYNRVYHTSRRENVPNLRLSRMSGSRLHTATHTETHTNFYLYGSCSEWCLFGGCWHWRGGERRCRFTTCSCSPNAKNSRSGGLKWRDRVTEPLLLLPAGVVMVEVTKFSLGLNLTALRNKHCANIEVDENEHV